MNDMIEVGAYEVKTHLAELLRKVKKGQFYRITVRGEPVAELVPLDETKRQKARQAVENMKRFMQEEMVQMPPGTLKKLIEEGRD
ncbi:MAG: type II toxin-antitoxin system prevent-host-death family antitoxin [Candidatus Thioglobus sp.]|nr:type II toxin-antitoxin system prevent-host-death family antitoxin [Candidatus Thioglobus sp.]